MNGIFLPTRWIKYPPCTSQNSKSLPGSQQGSAWLYPWQLINKIGSMPLRPWGMLILLIWMPGPAHATQMHSASEGILVHQLGHLFFLVSMGILILTIQGKQLHREKGWRLIQYSALFFILWNMDAIGVHLLDNQTSFISTRLLSMTRIHIEAGNHHEGLARFYYLLRLDHLLCLPAMMLLYRGISLLVKRKHLP